MKEVFELANYYVSFLIAIGISHRDHHWLAKGDNFYGNHLLFDRIYKTAHDDADTAAERFVGLFGPETVNIRLQAQLISKILQETEKTDDPISASLAVEKKFLEFSEKFYKILEKQNKLTLGLEDMLPAIASNREEACYLLQQTQKEHSSEPAPSNEKIAGRRMLLKRLLVKKSG